MSHFIHTSYFRAGPRSVTNPNKFIRQNSVSSLNGWTISTSVTSPHFCSPKPKISKKTATFASLGANAAVTGALHSGVHSAENRGRSISLFAPSSCGTHDSVYNADFLDPHSTFPQAMAGTSTTLSYSPSSSFSSINLDISLALPVSVPLPPSPILAANVTGTTDSQVPSLPLVLHSVQDKGSAQPASIRGRKELRQTLPSICPAMSKSSSQSSTSSETSTPSPTARSRRGASPSRTPPMHIISSTSKHTLNVQLPAEIQPEMVTISAKKGDKLAVVADAWHMEEDCHYEWQIRFAPHDIDMNSIRALFDDEGHLTINVERRAQYYPSFGGWGTRVI